MMRGLCVALTACLWAAAAWPAEPTAALAARIKRDTQRCEAHGSVDTCNDAIRWNPSDPALLAALGDAMMRANRPADAVRHYRRAASLAPKLPGLTAKIAAAEKRLAPARAAANSHHAPVSGSARAPTAAALSAPTPSPAAAPRAPAPPHDSGRAAALAASGKHFSNSGPETQSH